MANVRILASVIIGVLAFTAMLGWMILRFVRSMEDPRRVRKHLIIGGLLYVFGTVNAISEVVKGKQSALILAGLPIGLFFAYRYLRAASKIQLPPK